MAEANRAQCLLVFPHKFADELSYFEHIPCRNFIELAEHSSRIVKVKLSVAMQHVRCPSDKDIVEEVVEVEAVDDEQDDEQEEVGFEETEADDNAIRHVQVAPPEGVGVGGPVEVDEHDAKDVEHIPHQLDGVPDLSRPPRPSRSFEHDPDQLCLVGKGQLGGDSLLEGQHCRDQGALQMKHVLKMSLIKTHTHKTPKANRENARI